MYFVALACLALQTRGIPSSANFEYSGLPDFVGIDEPDHYVLVRSHSVKIDIEGKNAYVSSITEVKNQSNLPLAIQIVVPRGRVGDIEAGQPSFSIRAIFADKPLVLRPILENGTTLRINRKQLRYRSDLEGKVTIAPLATCGLRLNYIIPLGKAGADQRMRIAGYLFEGRSTVDQLQIAYRTHPGTAFSLPKASPAWGWDTGSRGSFAKRTHFSPHGELSTIVYYPSGFDDIG